MFREMTRKKQQLSDEECIRILSEEPRGVLSVLGDDDYPYGMPMSFLYDPESGHLFFHGNRKGHRVDSLIKHDKVSFCVCNQGFRKEGEWAWNISSVIVFGRIRRIEDPARIAEIAGKLAYKFTRDTEYIEKEIQNHASRALCLELIPEHISGKLVRES